MLLSDDGNGGKPQSQEDRLANISMQRPRRPLDSLVSLSRESKRSSQKDSLPDRGPVQVQAYLYKY